MALLATSNNRFSNEYIMRALVSTGIDTIIYCVSAIIDRDHPARRESARRVDPDRRTDGSASNVGS